MGIDFTNLALAPCIAAFGEPVIYQPGSGAAVSLTGIYNAVATEDKIDVQTGETKQVITPTVAINVNDLPAGIPRPAKGEAMIVRGVLWRIGASDPDNFGQLKIRLWQAQ